MILEPQKIKSATISIVFPSFCREVMVLDAMELKDTYSWKESYDQPRQHIKSRHITLSTKVRLVKAMVFPVVMDRCESWTIKKAEH